MLTAASSASFIKDEQLALLARTLGAAPNAAEAVLAPARKPRQHDLH
jgi:hypothetical protein